MPGDELLEITASLDSEIVNDLNNEAKRRRVSRSAVVRDWLRLGRDEDHRRRELLRRDRESGQAASSAA